VIVEARVHVCANEAAWREREGPSAEAVEIHVEVFELGAPVVGDLAFDTSADRPAKTHVANRSDRNAGGRNASQRAGGRTRRNFLYLQ
jgi:hypothetical protein